MEIRFVKRQEIIDSYLERVFNGYQLTKSDKDFLRDMSK